jgi:hypothetical protein
MYSSFFGKSDGDGVLLFNSEALGQIRKKVNMGKSRAGTLCAGKWARDIPFPALQLDESREETRRYWAQAFACHRGIDLSWNMIFWSVTT